MEKFRNEYKSRRFGFGNTGESQFIRTEKREKWRKSKRAEIFNENRNLLDSSVTTAHSEGNKKSPVVENRMTQLLKWKAKRELQKKLEQIKKKRPFVVGTVHHNIYSPGMKNELFAPGLTSKKVCKSNVSVAPLVPPKRITRATEKRLIYKTQVNEITKVQTKSTFPENKQSKVSNEKEYSFAPENHKFKPPEGLPQVPLFGRVRCTMTPVVSNKSVSTFSKITRSSRGNNNSNLAIEQINSKMLNTSYTIEKESDNGDNTEEGFIEPIVLKLSSDDEKNDGKSGVNSDNGSKENEKFNKRLNDSKKNRRLGDSKENKEISEKLDNIKGDKSDKKLNNSGKMSNITIRDNIKDVHDTINNTFRETRSSINNNTPKSVQSGSSSEPAFFSPYIVSSRGKSNARKEQQIKRGFSLGRSMNNDIPTKETVMKNLNISIDEEERTAQYFEFLLNKEIDRQRKLCEKWSKIKEEPGITEDAQYQINQAIGQTNLLMNKKFQRFRNLVSDCATGKGEMLVTCNDLQGFWDMMYMEVENCDIRFEKLEQLRSRNWKEEQVSAESKPIIKKKVLKKKALPTKSSNIRLFLAKKKQSMAEKTQSDIGMQKFGILNNEILNRKNEHNENSLSTKCKTRRSIGLSDKKYTPVKHDRTKLSLLEKVQFSDKKKMKSPLTIMKISKMCKTPEIKLDDTISYINSNQTPGKSILKHLKNYNCIGSSVKAVHKVNFNDSLILNEDELSEELQTKKDLAAAFAKIDSLDFDYASEETPIHAERELTFNDSFEESKNTTDANRIKSIEESKCKLINVPSMKIQNATPLQESILHGGSNTSVPRRVLRRQNALLDTDDSLSLSVAVSTPLKEVSDLVDLNTSQQKLQKDVSTSDTEKIDKYDDNIRVLRNRSIASGNLSIQKKEFAKSLCTSEQEFADKENKTSIKSKRNSLLKVSIKDDKVFNSKIELHDAIAQMGLQENTGKRRSSRKSVKFDEKECNSSVVKPAFPVTPRVTRSRMSSKSKGEV